MSSLPFPIANIGRQKRLFNPLDESEDTYIMDQEVGTDTRPAYQIPDMEDSAGEDYASHIQNMPVRENVGTGRKLLSALVAGLSAAGGENVENSVNLGSAVRDQKYNNSYRDWSQKAKQLENLSEISYRGLRAKAYGAQVRNKFNSDVENAEFKRDKEEGDRQNESLNRKAQGQHWSNLTAAFDRRTNVIKNKKPSTGSQVNKNISPANQQKAHDESVKEILLEEPNFEQYFDIDDKGKISGLRRDANGQIAKLAPAGTMFGGSKLTPQPLTPEDKQALQNFQIKLTDKIKKKLNLTLGNLDEITPDEFEFSDNPIEEAEEVIPEMGR